MKIYILLIPMLWLGTQYTQAQTDTIFTKGGQQIICNHIKETPEQYNFNYLNQANENAKSSILKYLVDSVKHFLPAADTNKIAIKIKKGKEKKAKVAAPQPINNAGPKAWTTTAAFGINLSNVLEFNTPSGSDKKSLGMNTSLDLGLNYRQEGKRFQMTNELHYLFGLQKNGLGSSALYQRISDEVNTLHDFSLGFGKKNKWNFNLITKFTTSFFSIYSGDYFKDVTNTGRIQSFLSPYILSFAPGIKYQPNNYFRLSISPYSVQITGIKNNEVANTGVFITDLDGLGHYKHLAYKRLGAELNFWYDRQVKDWLTMQYRLGLSSDYFEKIAQNGLMDGLFITKIKLIKDIYLTHRATIRDDLAGRIFKPFFSQTILLSYSKNF